MELQTQSTAWKKILHDTVRGRIIVVSASGVDVFRRSDWTRIAWATLANVTAGAINNSGIWLGTSDAGIYLLPHTARDAATNSLALFYDTTTGIALPSNAIADLAGQGDALAVAHGAGVSYLPSRSWIYNCTIAGGADAIALTTTKIAYAAGIQIYYGTPPSADWATTAHTNVSGAGAVAALALRGAVLFVAGADGLFTYSGSTLDDAGADVGEETPTSIWATSGATASSGYLAYGTSDGSNGGEFGVLDLGHTAPALPDIAGDATAVWVDDTIENWSYNDSLSLNGPVFAKRSGDATAVWIADDLAASLANTAVEIYRQVTEASPAENGNDVRRDWALYAEITDALGGIQSGTVALKVNGVSQTPTTSAITDGYAVTYTPAGNSGYGERVTIEISGTDADGNTVSRSWAFTTASAPPLTVTDSAPPNVICKRNIDLAIAESDETVDSVNVIWIDTITSPLIVTEAQAKEVGRVAIDGQTYHRHKVGVKVLATDSGGLQTRDLRQGGIATITCDALGMSAQKCEILAAQRVIDDGAEDISYTLQAAYYEEV